ncbi:hypothetical protein JCM15765_15070 [Paradesulfitobacterium aromaticivorans]
MQRIKKLLRAAVRALIGEQRIRESVRRIRKQRQEQSWKVTYFRAGQTIRREPKRWPESVS